MYPYDVHVFGTAVSVWNAFFIVAVITGYFVFGASVRAVKRGPIALEEIGPLLGVRYLVVVYLSALSAQVFAYAFDANTTLVPPPDVGLAAYYLNPFAGPKTLYGVIVLMPLSVALAIVGTRLSLARALDLWTPAMLVVLATARLGCFVQGCCFGARSDDLGISFPFGSPVYYQQLREGLIAEGSMASSPVIPAQAIEAAFLTAVALWSWNHLRHERRLGLFVPTIAAYSIFRFAIEFVRADIERGLYGPLATSQWIALMILAGATVVAIRTREQVAR